MYIGVYTQNLVVGICFSLVLAFSHTHCALKTPVLRLSALSYCEILFGYVCSNHKQTFPACASHRGPEMSMIVDVLK